MTQPELIIFDCDGVLVDSEPLANQVLADYLTELGLPCTKLQASARFVGLSFPSVRNIVETEYSLVLPSDFEDEIIRRDLLAFDRELQSMPGIETVLDNLKIPKCVASSGEHRKICHSLTLTGLLGKFIGNIFSAADVQNGKPAPDLFLHAALSMGAKPHNTIVIEDSIAGVHAGVAAGMRVLGFVGGGHIVEGHGDKLLKAGAAEVFDQMVDLGKFVRKS